MQHPGRHPEGHQEQPGVEQDTLIMNPCLLYQYTRKISRSFWPKKNRSNNCGGLFYESFSHIFHREPRIGRNISGFRGRHWTSTQYPGYYKLICLRRKGFSCDPNELLEISYHVGYSLWWDFNREEVISISITDSEYLHGFSSGCYQIRYRSFWHLGA